jgi:methylase of polypeptide subunit release factors
VAAIVSNLPFAVPATAIEFQRRDWPLGTATGPGADGLGLLRALARDARTVLAPGGCLLVAMQAIQGPWIAGYLEELGFDAEIPTAESGYIEVAARWPGSKRT